MIKQLNLFPACEAPDEGGRKPAPSRVFKVSTVAVYTDDGDCVSYEGTTEEVSDEDLCFQQLVDETNGVNPNGEDEMGTSCPGQW